MLLPWTSFAIENELANWLLLFAQNAQNKRLYHVAAQKKNVFNVRLLKAYFAHFSPKTLKSFSFALQIYIFLSKFIITKVSGHFHRMDGRKSFDERQWKKKWEKNVAVR